MTNGTPKKRELSLRRDLADEIVQHCLDQRPNEACGILASHDGEIVQVFRMRNAAASPVRYELDGREQLEVDKRLDDQGWYLEGVFHSHTHTEAYPSPTDIAQAVVDLVYVIVSLAEEPASIRAFRIHKADPADMKGEVEEVPVVVVG